MTDEEMAEEYAKGLCKTCTVATCRYNIFQTCAIKESIKQAHLAGLEAGRPKWHKVADGDLPKEEAEYLVIFESDGTRYTGLEIYYPDTKEWSTICNIIAWWEIPEFEEGTR